MQLQQRIANAPAGVISHSFLAPAAIRRICLLRYDATAAADIIRYALFGPLSLMPNTLVTSNYTPRLARFTRGREGGMGYFLHSGRSLFCPRGRVMLTLPDGPKSGGISVRHLLRCRASHNTLLYGPINCCPLMALYRGAAAAWALGHILRLLAHKCQTDPS